MSLPENYIEWVTRVSSLVEHKYPFEWTYWEKQYLNWLYSKIWSTTPYVGDYCIKKAERIKKQFPDIKQVERVLECEKIYIKEACDVWTFVHLQMEHKVLGDPLDFDDSLFQKHQNEIVNWLNFMDDYNLTDMETEVYCRDKHNRYQGSIDLLASNAEWKKVLIDWKTWGIAKKRFGLPNSKTKPYSKLKKVALQMSLYAKALWNIDEIWVVRLHEEGYFAYKLDIVPDEELDALIISHQTKDLSMPQDSNIIINYEPMRIEIQTVVPGQQYSKAAITLEKEDCDNGKTVEENITTAIQYQKALINKYKEINGN